MSRLQKSQSRAEANLLARAEDGTTGLGQLRREPTLEVKMMKQQREVKLSGVTNEWAIFDNRYLKGIQSHNKDTELEGPDAFIFCAITWNGVIYCGTENGLWKREGDRWIRAFNPQLRVKQLVSWESLLAIRTDNAVHIVASADGVRDFLDKDKSVRFDKPIVLTAWLHGIVVIWNNSKGARVLSVANRALTNFTLPFLGPTYNLAGSSKLWTTYNSIFFVPNSSTGSAHRVAWRGDNEDGTLRLKHRRVTMNFFKGTQHLVQWDNNIVKVESSRNTIVYFSAEDSEVSVLWENPRNLQIDSFGSYLSEETQCNEETLYATAGNTVYCWHVVTDQTIVAEETDDVVVDEVDFRGDVSVAKEHPVLPPLDGFTWKLEPSSVPAPPPPPPAPPASPASFALPAPPASPAPQPTQLTPKADRGPAPPLPPRPTNPPQLPQQPPKCPAAAKRQARYVSFTETETETESESEDPGQANLLIQKLLNRREAFVDIADEEKEEDFEDDF